MGSVVSPARVPVEIRSRSEVASFSSTEVFLFLQFSGSKDRIIFNSVLSVSDDDSNVGRLVFGKPKKYKEYKIGFHNAKVLGIAFPVDPSNFKYLTYCKRQEEQMEKLANLKVRKILFKGSKLRDVENSLKSKYLKL